MNVDSTMRRRAENYSVSPLRRLAFSTLFARVLMRHPDDRATRPARGRERAGYYALLAKRVPPVNLVGVPVTRLTNGTES